MAKGQRIGYVRVSTVDQNTARQLAGVELDRVFEDKASGKDTKRPKLQECLRFVREGDTLYVHSMDRLARSLLDLWAIVEELTGRGVTIQFAKEGLTFTAGASPMAKLQLSIMGAVAQFEREIIRERQREGIAIARAAGKYSKERAKKLTPQDVTAIREQAATGVPKAEIARAYGVSRETLYVYLRGRGATRAATAAAENNA
jgi:DNA invertase Pin-like site-specific DNA recombinase